MKPKPNGVVPADANDCTLRIAPSCHSVIVSIVFEPVLVTASAVPAGLSEICAAPESVEASGAEPPAIGASPCPVAQKPATLFPLVFTT